MKKISTIACFLALSVFVPTALAQRTAEDHFKTSHNLLRSRDLDGALASKVIERQPRLPAAYLERGATLLLMGKDAEAEKDFAQCLALDARMATTVENRRTAAKSQREKEPK